MPERGEIKNRDRAKQLRDFRGLRWGNITPTDLDMLTDFRDKLTIKCEYKLKGQPLEEGQQKALERDCDDVGKSKPCFLIIAEHEQWDAEKDINCAEAIVIDCRFDGKWYKPKSPINVKTAIDKLLEKYKIKI